MKKKYWIYLLLFFAMAAWSGYKPFDPILWLLEAGICVAGVAILAATFKRFQFTDLTYTFILIHIAILFVGAHYSYARVPVFEWLREACDLSRNNFDKVGHFAQGFVPAMISRELLIRLNVINRKLWIPFLVICISLAISAFYELIEWWVAILSNDGAEEFLGMQGYEWDTQSDMLYAMVGAVVMLVLLSKTQDKQIKNILATKTK